MKLSVIFAELAAHGSAAHGLTPPRADAPSPSETTPGAPPAATSPDSSSPQATPVATAETVAASTATPAEASAPAAPGASSATSSSAATSSPGNPAAPASPVVLPRKIPSDISIGDILALTQRAGFGFAMAFVAIISIPFVGMSMPFGLAIAGLAWQLFVGRKHPWLPKRVRDHHVSIKTIDLLGTRVAKVTMGMEKIVRPRFAFLTTGLMLKGLAFSILLQAVGLALPLPLPGSNWFFIFPIIIFSIALMEEDGLLALVGHLLQIVQVVVVWAFWHLIEGPVIKLWHMIVGWFH